MSDAQDATLRWFGLSWGAPACEEALHVATPVGQPCAACPNPIAPGDSGFVVTHLTALAPETSDGVQVASPPERWIAMAQCFHLDCWGRMIVPPERPPRADRWWSWGDES